MERFMDVYNRVKADYVDNWENTVRQPQGNYPSLVGVVYFNQVEVYPWPENFGLPDWRVRNRVLD